MKGAVPVLDLGLVDYLPAQQLQQRLRHAVAEGSLTGALLLLEHPPIITFGNRGGSDDLRAPAALNIPVLRSERGGAATLHAPGQLVTYPILPIPGRNLHRYVLGLEEVLRLLLAGLGLSAERRPKRPGLYIEGRKIASVGLRTERWIASHGTSLNVSIDLSLFDLIVSCGEQDLQQTSILELRGSAPTMQRMKQLYVQAFGDVFSFDLGALRRASGEGAPELLGLPSA